MNQNISPFETPDYPPSSGISELDSLSDSDWLDVASNRESDDNDSVISGDSDRDQASFRVPLSRRSSMSIGSSREGDIEAWEGFVDDSGDEDTPKAEAGIPQTKEFGELPVTLGGADLAGSEHELAEEQRVKEALDQSLMSTLSASRSSSASTHNSLRDLRLSFPDPLTSSHDELHRSYGEPSPSETTFTTTDVATDDATDEADLAADLPLNPPRNGNSGLFTAPSEVLQDDVRLHPQGINNAEFEVALYGRASSIKWSFVKDLVHKAVVMSGRSVVDISPSTTDNVRLLRLKRQIEEPLFSSEFVPIRDMTDGTMILAGDMANRDVMRPSLAIVYLPSPLNDLPTHTLYLPVLVPGPIGYEDETVRGLALEDWDSLCIPSDKIVHLNGTSVSPLFDGRDTDQIEYLRAHQVLQHLITQAKKSPMKIISEHLNSVHAVTLFALISMIVGFAINTAFRVSFTPTPTTGNPTSSTFWGIFGPEINQTTVFATTAKANAPLATASHKDFSLSVINPGTTSLALTSRDNSVVPIISAAPEVESTGNKPFPRTDNLKSVRDVIVRPTTQLLAVDAKPSMTVPSRTRNAIAGPSKGKSTSLSLRAVGSLSEVLDGRMKSLVNNVRNDLDELIESLDELTRAIHRQTQATLEQSKGKAKAIRKRVSYRNDRARIKAKELRRKGEAFISLAGEQFKGRTKIAKKRARHISQSFAASDAWQGYRKLHSDWVAKLKEKGDNKRVHSQRSKCNQSKEHNVLRVRGRAPRLFACA